MGIADSQAGQVAPVVVHDGLAVYQIGHGRPILLMPGPHRFERPGLPVMDALINGLTGIGRQVITFDPPGSGYSTRPARLGMAELHQCTRQALDACRTDAPVDSIGHSMGGLALLGHALDHPARIGRVVLVGAGAGGRAYRNAPGALWRRGHPRFWQVATLGMLHLGVRRLATERMLNNLIDRESFVDQRHVRPQPVTAADWLRPATGRADWHLVARKLDFGPRLPEIEHPVLVLCGRHDPQYPPACSAELAAKIRCAQLVWFEHSGHYPFIEEPAEFWVTVSEFLNPTATDGG